MSSPVIFSTVHRSLLDLWGKFDCNIGLRCVMYIGVDFDARDPWQFQAQIAVVKTIFTENPELLSEKKSEKGVS